jgi:hypothetical protein
MPPSPELFGTGDDNNAHFGAAVPLGTDSTSHCAMAEGCLRRFISARRNAPKRPAGRRGKDYPQQELLEKQTEKAAAAADEVIE